MNEPERQAEYIQTLKSFNPRLVSILPDRIPNNMLTMGYSSLINLQEYGNPAGIRMTTKISSLMEYNELKNQFRSKALYVGLPSDSCLLIIGSDEQPDIKNTNCTSIFPIPYRSAFVLNKSNKDWERKTREEIYIVDYQYGDLISNANSLEETSGSKDAFSNGFSTGINTNDENQTVEYWMINW